MQIDLAVLDHFLIKNDEQNPSESMERFIRVFGRFFNYENHQRSLFKAWFASSISHQKYIILLVQLVNGVDVRWAMHRVFTLQTLHRLFWEPLTEQNP